MSDGMRTSLRKVLICPFFGDRLPWMTSYWANADRLEEQGYDFLLEDDEDEFRDRVRDILHINCPPMYGTGNIWDFRPALGLLYADEIKDFDWWGHTDFDCVYGRVEQFVTDDVLDSCDIYSDCAHGYIAGPWSLYRNNSQVNGLFASVSSWEDNLESPSPTGWCETTFSLQAQKRVRLRIENNHAFTEPEKLRMEGERLMHGQKEISFYHFRHTKVWPL